jgi:hypothetical protein
VRDSRKRDRWLAGAVVNAILGVILTFGVGELKDRLKHDKPNCSGLYSQLAQVVDLESKGVADAAIARDPRYIPCGKPLGSIEQGAISDKPDIDVVPPKPTVDCVAFYYQVDELADDESRSIAESVSRGDPRGNKCKAWTELLGQP